jgi:hypothetical protein
MNERTDRLLTVDGFPEELHHRLKVMAATERITMRQAVIEAITVWCDGAARPIRPGPMVPEGTGVDGR